jgi:hypothetical protein
MPSDFKSEGLRERILASLQNTTTGTKLSPSCNEETLNEGKTKKTFGLTPDGTGES